MEKVRVEARNGSYDIEIGPGLIAGWTPPEQYAVVTDKNVHALYGERFPKDRYAAVLPAGEGSKRIVQLEQILEAMVRMDLDRSATLVALGGGVVGDIAGLAAAMYKRGIPYVQMPTTLLAQVDSSVGGKVAVDLAGGKNLAGAFYQPSLVLADTTVLSTLPKREWAAGMAEVIKYGYIADEKLHDALARGDTPVEWMVSTCCAIKARYVREDPFDTGVRMQLNYGHTLGHAIELSAGYGTYLHGEAVAAGMVYAARLGEALSISPKGLAEDTASLVRQYGLPDSVDVKILQTAIGRLGTDKKIFGGHLKMVFVDRIGHAVLQEVAPGEIMKVLVNPS